MPAGFCTINVAGSSDVNLTPDQAGSDFLVFTGALTGNINVTLPASPFPLVEGGPAGSATLPTWLKYFGNRTTGDFGLNIKSSTGSGVGSLLAGNGTNTYGWRAFDGSNVVGDSFTPHELSGLVATLDATQPSTSAMGTVISAPNGGSMGGVWVPGTNSQVPGQGLGPVFDPNGVGAGKPGFTFDESQASTLKVNPVSPNPFNPNTVTGFVIVKAQSIAVVSDHTNTIVSLGGFDTFNQSFEIFAERKLATTPQIMPSADYFDDSGAGHAVHAPPVDPGVLIMTAIVSGTVLTLRVNGVVVATRSDLSLGGFTIDEMVVGAFTDAYANDAEPGYFTGSLGQLLLYNRVLTNTEILFVEAWLAQHE